MCEFLILKSTLLLQWKRINKAICPFWSWSPVVFVDVDPNIDKVKHYFSSSSESIIEANSKASSDFKSSIEESKENNCPNKWNFHPKKLFSNSGEGSLKKLKWDKDEYISMKSKRNSSSTVKFLASLNPSQPNMVTKWMQLDVENKVVSPTLIKRNSATNNKYLSSSLSKQRIRKLPIVNTQLEVVPLLVKDQIM